MPDAQAAAPQTPPNKPDDARFVVIIPQTRDGRRFRPSDWCDRLIGALHVLGEEEFEKYAEYVHQVNYCGAKCVTVDKRLEDVDARMFRFFINFAADNNLLTAEVAEDAWREPDQPA